jgi:hypothetical protein
MRQLAHQGVVHRANEMRRFDLALTDPELAVAHAQALLPVPMDGLELCAALAIGLQNAVQMPIGAIGHQNVAGRLGGFLGPHDQVGRRARGLLCRWDARDRQAGSCSG